MKGDQHIGGQHKIDGDYNHHQRIREKLSQPEPIVTALEFLKKLRPPGPWVLTAVKPNGPAETITARNGDEVRDFIAKHDGRRNLYYSVNPTKTTATTKPSKADIAAAEFIHADLDPRDDETPEEAKRRYRRSLNSFRPKPTAIIDSGNGLQALWRLDPPVSAKHFDEIEACNQAVVLALGGKSGTQDISRILRLPGTKNLPTAAKRKVGRTACRARLIAFNNATYQLTDFPMPDDSPKRASKNASASSQKQIPPKLTRSIRDGVDEPHRSDKSFHVVAELKRRLWTVTEIFELLNKYPGGIAAKYVAGNRLLGEIERCYKKTADGEDTKKERLNSVCAAEVEMKSVEWIWPQRIARRKVTMMSGEPGVGKSQIAIDVAARITRGSKWPDGGRAPSGSVVLLSAEDALDDTITPHLKVAGEGGGDLNRVHVVTTVTGEGGDRMVNLQCDLGKLAELVADLGDVQLVIIDPISAYMGKIDSHKNTEVRQVLAMVKEFAEDANVAVLAIHHPPKGAKKAIEAVCGSIAFGAAPRFLFLVAREPDTDRRLLLPVKQNNGREAAGLGFYIEEASAGRACITSRIEWDDAPVEITANEALNTQEGRGYSKIQEAKDFLMQELAKGPVAEEQLLNSAEARGISGATLRRAKQQLGVVSKKQGFEGRWAWRMPEKD